jgi:hypothetical protein
MASQTEVTTASAADIAADMETHRATYRGFFNFLKYGIVGIAVLLAILFFTLN